MAGHPETEAMHLTERFTRRDVGHMDVQFTIDDPKAYTEPWTVSSKIHSLPVDDTRNTSAENNKAPGHMVGKINSSGRAPSADHVATLSSRNSREF